jgi:hypothetical protein
MDDSKSIRQMSPDEVYDKYTKPYWLLFLLLEFIAVPALVLIGFRLLGGRPAWVLPMIIVYLALETTSVCSRGRSLGGVRFR